MMMPLLLLLHVLMAGTTATTPSTTIPLPPATQPNLTFTHVITANDVIRSCYRNPVLTLLDDQKTLLCFVEERSRGPDWEPGTADHSCPDNYNNHDGNTTVGGHNLGYMTSTDYGATWSGIRRLAGNVSNLMATNGVDYTNNAVLQMSYRNGSRGLLYQYGTQNNPSLNHHGMILQRTSVDNGESWSAAAAFDYGAAVGFPGATPGPGQGVQLNDTHGTIAFCAWGNKFNGSFGPGGWGNAGNFGNFIAYSTDYGSTWAATAPVEDEGWNECFIASLPPLPGSTDPRLIEISRRTLPDKTVAKQYPPHTYATLTFSGAKLADRTAAVTLPDVETPVCEGSLVSHGGALYFSHPQSTTERTALTIHKSVDEGKSWLSSVLVWSEKSGSGYSSMAAIPGKGMAIAFNQWPTNDTKSSADGPGQYITFTLVPFAAFPTASTQTTL